MAVAVAAADKLSGATLPPSGNTLPLRGLKMAVAEAVAAAVSLSATVASPKCVIGEGLVYTITNLQMTLTPTWLSCYTFG